MDPSPSFIPTERSVVSGAGVQVTSTEISSDLLHQAFQEVAQQQGLAGVSVSQEVKLEPQPDVYNRMEQLLASGAVSGPLTPIQGLQEDKVKLEVPHVIPHLGGGAGPVLLVPSLQSEGVLTYAVQTGPGQGSSYAPHMSLAPVSTVRPGDVSVTSPIKAAKRIPVLRNSQKQKVILPKTPQQQPIPVSSTCNQQLRTNLIPTDLGQKRAVPLPATQTHQIPTIRINPGVQKPREMNVRKVQLITGLDSEIKNIELLATPNGETRIRYDKPLTDLEMQYVKSIIQHQRENGGGGEGGARQVYRVVYPSHLKPEKTGKPKAIDFIDLEEEAALTKNNVVEEEQPFSVAALVKEFSKRGRGKHRNRGRPKKGMPKVFNEKKVINELKKEFGLREERVKEFGLVEQSEEESHPAESESESPGSASRTRSGRLSRPPTKVRSKEDTDNVLNSSDDMSIMDKSGHDSAPGGAVTNSCVAPPPQVPDNIPLPARRNFIPPAKYICKVCGKLYLGDKKIAKHLKHYPSHEFATPEPPISPIIKENIKRSPSFENYISECDSNKFIEQIGAKLFKSFSLWDLVVKKTIAKRLGTVESLMSLFADMQAIVIELKNLVDQCLTCERNSEESLRVTLTPIMSSVLGLSQSGSVSRYILPHTQIPEHYHTLLSLPAGLGAGAARVTSSTEPGLLSPESTTSLMHPEEENSQMSLASDIMDQPLSEKVVLEDNLCNRQMIQDMDEETQDSSITAPSPVPHPLKRAREDSECELISPPPQPQTPDFLSQGDDSNISIISTTVSEPSKALNVQSKKPRPNDYLDSVKNIQGDSLHTKLPSFSSIINCAPKQDDLEDNVSKIAQTETQSQEDSMVIRIDADVAESPSKASHFHHVESSVHVSTSFDSGGTKTSLITASPLARLSNMTQESFADRGESVGVGGSAPVSPRVRYGSSGGFSRRCSLDNTRSLPDTVILGLAPKLQDSSSEIMEMNLSALNPDTTSQDFAKHDALPGIADVNTFPLEDRVSSANMKGDTVTEGSVVTSYQYQAMITTDSSPQAYFSTNTQASGIKTLETSEVCYHEKSLIQNTESEKFIKAAGTTQVPESTYSRDTFSPSSITSDFEQSIPPLRSSILKAPPKSQTLGYTQGSSTHVTFSEELSHPIPSVSPAKDFREIDLKRQNPTPPSESQSSSIFSDLESVLNEAGDFTFHSELGGAERCQVKTPEKLLHSVPPAAVMDKKTAISFDNILSFEKATGSKQMQGPVCQSSIVTNDEASNNITMIPSNIHENSSTYPYPSPSTESGNC